MPIFFFFSSFRLSVVFLLMPQVDVLSCKIVSGEVEETAMTSTCQSGSAV